MTQNTFGIYQIKDGERARPYRFEGLERLKALGLSVERRNYEEVYSAPFYERIEFLTDRYRVLNKIHETFNTNLPDDYTGRSVSVSDVIVLRWDGQSSAHFVDRAGFTEIDGFAAGRPAPEVYKYYSTQRPVDMGTFPKTEGGPTEIVNFDGRRPVERGQFAAWGYLEYSAPLTERQIGDCELKASPGNPDVKRRMEGQTQIVGHWEDMKKVPEEKRLTWFKPSIHAYALREPVTTPELLSKRHELALRDFARQQTVEDQAQVVGKWEKAHRVPDTRRLTWWHSDFGVFVKNEFVTPKQLAERHGQIVEAKARAAEKRAAKKPIKEQLAEAEKQAERGAETPAPGKSKKAREGR
jgi:hypothetical protein